MTTMTTFYAHTNRFTGSLPPQYGAWTMLTQIDVSFNMLTGTLPDDYRLWAGIQDIVVKSNMLTGVVPVTWGEPSFANLRLLNVEDTCLKGWLPAVLSSVATLKICNTHIIERTNCATSGGSWPAFCPNETKTVSLSSSMTGTEGSHSLKAGSETASRSAHTHLISRSAHTRTISRSAPTRTTSRNAYTPTAPMSVSLLRCTPYESTANVAVTLTAPLATLPPRSTASSLAVALSSLMPVETNVSFVPSSLLPSPPPPPLVVITTTPIARSTLVQAPEFVFNLSFTAPANAVRWTVTNVVYQTTPAGSTPNDNNVTLDWSSSSTVANQASTVTSTVLAVQPPKETGVWLLSNAGVLVGQTLSLRIAFACGGEEVLVVELQIPAPGYPQQLASQVEAATRYAQVASALAGGASSGTALGRVMAIRSMVVCDADASVGGGVLDFGIQLCPSSAETDVARSAVVSNVVALACVFVFLLLLSCVWAHARGVSLRSALLVFSMPSSAYPACVAVLPSTSAAIALLIARVNSSTCVGLDAVLIGLGLIVAVGCECALTAVWMTGHCGDNTIHNVPRWECRQRPRHLPANDARLISLYARVFQPFAAVVLHRAWKWHATLRSSRVPLKRAWAVLLEYRVLWFATLDSGMLVVVAVLAVVGGLEGTDSSLCRSVVSVVLVLMVCQLLLMMLLRPYTTLFSAVHGVVTLALTCLSIAAQIAFIVTLRSESPHLWLVNASAGCNLAVVGVTAVKMMFDAKDVLDAIRRRLNGTLEADDENDDRPTTLVVVNVCDDDDEMSYAAVATHVLGATPFVDDDRDVPCSTMKRGDEMLVVNPGATVNNKRLTSTSSHGSASKSPLSPKVARIQSVGDALELSSSSFELERANAQFWDASGTARVLK
ncbi:GP46-like surface antigen, putative [Bodo saltans]|uniref:GP46-like surface antigen, putative n=1 Tax=Bodo saltans TaxID=75058 RepID=A0A0S4IMY9_BODSA|nr:GP46-like surface antigen, putative [Bodo saltans]|eukprot:CUE76391.1 GP46-like surface antigen, putative [Bodo saltans]